ncbi:hypothetical protein [Actinomyces glycerinitolerans]|uniref:Uncharacterized protein n=1 Tax=Actinomyces glycerinitolerans TaxID=1892869 RepID=A0A1M4S3F4_9ACTO|nr:hypothetical protein [Actinomyces glycerinitolerans]SHE26735.1 Hypothetical protein ACGLYG10_2989 [Actinomyces glycerinitolerans]
MEWNTDSSLEVSTIMRRVTAILDEHNMCVLGAVGAQEPRLTPCTDEEQAPLGPK